MLTKLIVYHGGERVGCGFALWFDDRHHNPILMTDDGKPLAEDWYTLIPEDQFLVVISRMVH